MRARTFPSAIQQESIRRAGDFDRATGTDKFFCLFGFGSITNAYVKETCLAIRPVSHGRFATGKGMSRSEPDGSMSVVLVDFSELF